MWGHILLLFAHSSHMQTYSLPQYNSCTSRERHHTPTVQVRNPSNVPFLTEAGFQLGNHRTPSQALCPAPLAIISLLTASSLATGKAWDHVTLRDVWDFLVSKHMLAEGTESWLQASCPSVWISVIRFCHFSLLRTDLWLGLGVLSRGLCAGRDFSLGHGEM